MGNSPNERPDQVLRPELIIEGLVKRQARVAGDVIEIDPQTWAVHGVIPVDGDVIMGEFDSPQDARAVLDQLSYPDDTGA